MFCVLFNHKSESPSFIVAIAGIAIWFAVSARDRATWSVLAVVVIGTMLSSNDVMPVALQKRVFDPYRFKTLPVLLVWAIVQWRLWRLQPALRTASTPPPSPRSGRAVPAT
jgi:hypothetical protein